MRHATTLVKKLQKKLGQMIDDDIIETGDPELNNDIRRQMKIVFMDKSRVMYSSIIQSLGNIMRQGILEYEAKVRSQNTFSEDPAVAISKYKDVAISAHDMEKVVAEINAQLTSDYGLQAINNKSCNDMGMLADVVSGLTGMGQ